jgi:hypothetical protein
MAPVEDSHLLILDSRTQQQYKISIKDNFVNAADLSSIKASRDGEGERGNADERGLGVNDR